jgi:hypothetical protein
LTGTDCIDVVDSLNFGRILIDFFFHFAEFSYCILAEYENKDKLNYGNLHIKIFTKDQTVTTAAVV